MFPGRIRRAWLPAVVLAGCAQSPTSAPTSKQSGELHRELGVDRLLTLPVPAQDGPKLAPITMATPVFAKPNLEAERVGYLRLGAQVARSEQPVSRENCPAGWYAVRPVGFVCLDRGATLDMENPLVRAVYQEPDRSKPMPYHYAFVRAVAPNYTRVPSANQQFEHEMRLERHLRNWHRFRKEWDHLDVGANDVPLDAKGLALGGVPEGAKALPDNQRFGALAQDDQVPWWLAGGQRLIPNVSTFQVTPNAVMAGRVKRHAGVSLLGSFMIKDNDVERRFAISADARLIPADKLKADAASSFHGGSIRESGLPAAFAMKAGASRWSLREGDPARGARLGLRELDPLTGRTQRVGGDNYLEARDGTWLRADDVKTAKKPMQLPSFAKADRRWVQISLTAQTLVLWEGDRPVYATLVSTGRDGLGDPKTTLSTPQGTFRIAEKHVTHTMDSNVADSEFELRDVPWVMYFQGGYALHAAYWHDDFGRPRSHGCVNMAPIDARYVFEWSSPDVPQHWHGARSGDTFDKGTIVQIGP